MVNTTIDNQAEFIQKNWEKFIENIEAFMNM